MAEETVKARPMKSDVNGIFNDRYNPIDIIIPFHGHYSKVTKLIQSIIIYTDWPFSITLVDDASPNEAYGKSMTNPETIGMKKSQLSIVVDDVFYKLINVVRNETQLGFGASVMKGYEASFQHLIVVIHSDCEIVNKLWLSDLIKSLTNLKKHGVKMVSPKTNNPVEGSKYLLASEKGISGNDLILNGDVIEDEAYLPMYCAIFHRQLFQQIGGLRPYPYGWYECVEFANRMRINGFKQGVSGKSWISHEGGMTVNSLEEAQMIEMRENKNRCIADIKRLQEPKLQAAR